jgi:glutathione S-transferase
MVLYDLERSGNCYKIRLLLALLGADYEKRAVDLAGGELNSEAFVNLNPRGQVPVLVDGEAVIWDSTAILVYLARKAGVESWLPLEPGAMAAVMQWLALEQNEGRYGLARARAVALKLASPFATGGRMDECLGFAHVALEVLEQRLAKHPWLASTTHPTIADIACYPYAALATDADIDLAPYESVRRWFAGMESLPGYVPLPGRS